MTVQMPPRYEAMYLVSLVLVCTISLWHSEQLLTRNALATTQLPFASTNDDGSSQKRTSTAAVERIQQKYDRVIHWQGKADLKRFMKAYFAEKNIVCDLVNNTAPNNERILLNITFGCHELFYNSGLGSGNFVAGFYAIRLAAAFFFKHMDVVIDCPDAHEERGTLLLPWLTGYFFASSSSNDDDADAESTRRLLLLQDLRRRQQQKQDRKWDAVCQSIDACPIGYMYPQVQYELRRMALAMVGLPPPSLATFDRIRDWIQQQQSHKHYHQQRLKLNVSLLDDGKTDHSNPPLYPHVQLDDVIIHFRCGDLMASNHPRFAFLKYEALTKRIWPSAQSIGIVTQPYDDNDTTNVRAWDASAVKRQRCKIVVTDFQNYVQDRFPRARITIHNAPNETIALTYARMIVANQTIAGISTFGVFASIASFGTGYIRLPDERSATNNWLSHPIRLDSIMDDLVLMEEPNILMVRKVKKLWQEENGKDLILQWFRDPSIRYD